MRKVQESDSQVDLAGDGLTEEEKLDVLREIHEVDACEICHGAKGGVLGNENIITVNGEKKIACDYCTAELDPGPFGEPVPWPGKDAKFVVEPKCPKS